MIALATHLLAIVLGALLCLFWPTKKKLDYANGLNKAAEDIYRHYGATVPNTTEKAFLNFWICRLNEHFNTKI